MNNFVFRKDFLGIARYFAVLTLFAGALYIGCNRGTAASGAVPALSAQEHLAAAEELKKGESDEWSLAIWHYQQFLEKADERLASGELDRAKVQLEELRRSYVAIYAGISQSALETENTALRRGNKMLEDQLERLRADNAVLNSTLLKMQQAQGR